MAKAIHSMIRVLDEARSVDFYKRAFGLEVADRCLGASAHPSHALQGEQASSCALPARRFSEPPKMKALDEICFSFEYCLENLKRREALW